MSSEPWRELSLLSLFKKELFTQSEILSIALTNLQISGPGPHNLQVLRSAAHSIKGAARIINLHDLSAAAGALEKLFDRDQDRTAAYTEADLGLLEQTIGTIHDLAQMAEPDLVAAAETQTDLFQSLTTQLQTVAGEGQTTQPPEAQPAVVEQRDPDPPSLISTLDIPAQIDVQRLAELAAQAGIVLPTEGLDEDPEFSDDQAFFSWPANRSPSTNSTVDFPWDDRETIATDDHPSTPDGAHPDLSEADLSLNIPEHIDAARLAELAAETGIVLPTEGLDEDPEFPGDEAFFSWPGVSPTQADTEVPWDDTAGISPSLESSIGDSAHGDLSEPELADLSMLDLFRSEAESHTATLVAGLLALERQPDALGAIHELMRAAHSLKVAASIVQLPVLVDLAHGMEDKLVAAQQGKLKIDSKQVDLLLSGVDIFNQLLEKNDEALLEWIATEAANIAVITERFTQDPIASKGLSAKTPAAQPDQETQPDSEEDESDSRQKTAARDAAFREGEDPSGNFSREPRRNVRISAEKLDRLMAVSSQFFVATRSLDKYTGLFSQLKQQYQQLNDQLLRLETHLNPHTLDPSAAHYLAEARNLIVGASKSFADHLPNFAQSTSQLIQFSNQLHHTVISSRMTPFGEGLQTIPRMVRDLAKAVDKKVRLEIRGSDTEADRDIIEKLLPPLKHLVRNALDHGIESPSERLAAGKAEEAMLLIDASHQAGMLTIVVEDDGRGVDYDLLRNKVVERGLADTSLASRLSEKELIDFLFLPGFSTAKKVSSLSGRGVGLDVVYSMVHEIGGSLRASSQPGHFMRIQLMVPVTLSVVRTLISEIEDQPYAIPLAKIRFCSIIDTDRVFTLNGQRFLRWQEENVGLIDGRQVVGLPRREQFPPRIHVVFFQLPDRTLGFIVDRFLGHRHLVVRPIDERIGEIPDINAAAIMEDGRVVLIFHADELMLSLERTLEGQSVAWPSRPQLRQTVAREKLRVLVVDDSATVREVQRQLLEERGYSVDLAEDGKIGLKALARQSYDLVISDVDMPRMNGLQFVEKIRAHPQLSHLPVLMVSYRDSERDRSRGLETGADAYLTKNDLHTDKYLETVQTLLDKVTSRH